MRGARTLSFSFCCGCGFGDSFGRGRGAKIEPERTSTPPGMAMGVSDGTGWLSYKVVASRKVRGRTERWLIMSCSSIVGAGAGAGGGAVGDDIVVEHESSNGGF